MGAFVMTGHTAGQGRDLTAPRGRDAVRLRARRAGHLPRKHLKKMVFRFFLVCSSPFTGAYGAFRCSFASPANTTLGACAGTNQRHAMRVETEFYVHV